MVLAGDIHHLAEALVALQVDGRRGAARVREGAACEVVVDVLLLLLLLVALRVYVFMCVFMCCCICACVYVFVCICVCVFEGAACEVREELGRRRKLVMFLAGHADLGWHYLSNATCLIRPRSSSVCFVVSRITIVCKHIRHFRRAHALDK